MKLFSTLLVVCAVLLMGINILTMLTLRNYRHRVELDYVVTEAGFNRAVLVAVSNYLDQVTYKADGTRTNKVVYRSELLRGATVYPDYRRGQYVLYVDGVSYRRGDLYRDYVVDNVLEDRVLCYNDLDVVVFRPAPMSDAPLRSARAEPVEKFKRPIYDDAPLD